MSIKRVGQEKWNMSDNAGWTQYQPTFGAVSSNPANWSRTSNNTNKYNRIGDLVIVQNKFTAGASATLGSGIRHVTAPFKPRYPISESYSPELLIPVGQWFEWNTAIPSSPRIGLVVIDSYCYTNSVVRLAAVAQATMGGSPYLRRMGDGTEAFMVNASGDTLELQYFYEAAV